MRGIVKGGLNDGGSGGGGFWFNDWSAYDTLYNWSGTTTSVPGSSWATFINITGEGAVVYLSADRNESIRITIDGNAPIVFSGVSLNAFNGMSNLMYHPIVFKSSLKVEVFNSFTSALSLFLDYTILKKKSSTDPEKQTILTQSQRLLANSGNSTTSIVDVVNISGSGYLLGIQFSGEASSAVSAKIRGNVVIDGINVMTNRDVVSIFSSAAPKLHEFKGPIRFNSSLNIKHSLTAASAGTSWTKVWYTLD